MLPLNNSCTTLLFLTHTNIHYRFDVAHSTFFHIQENTHDHNCCSQYKQLLSCCLLLKLLLKKHCDFLFGKKITWTVTPCILNNFFNHTHTHTLHSRHNSFLMHTNIHYRFSTAPLQLPRTRQSSHLTCSQPMCNCSCSHCKEVLSHWLSLNSNLGNTLMSSFLTTT